MRVLLALFVLTAACGSSHAAPADASADGQIVFAAPDAGPTSPDAGRLPGEGAVGAACTTDTDCANGGTCQNDPAFLPGGYCVVACTSDADCPSGSSCTPVSRTASVCLDTCDPSATTPECRPGYGCAVGVPTPVCLGGCSGDGDCAAGASCDVGGGPVGSGACFTPGAAIGAACTSDAECSRDAICYGEDAGGWPGGACLGAAGCDVASGTGCDGDAVCLDNGGGGGVCVDGCTSDGDCRTSYRCTADTTYPDRRYCGPGCASDGACTGGGVCNPALGTCDVAFDPSGLGAACSRDPMVCAGGSCLFEYATGFPGSYCAYAGCTPGGTDCPGSGVCAPSGTTGVCLESCGVDGDCRTGYACRPSDAADPSSALACVPACTSDGQCANMGFVCNDGTGRCTMAFDATRIGQACAAATDCPGGLCVTDGYPGGMCVALGCRTSGDGASEPCPTGSTCVDDARGSPDIGWCMPSCSDASPCRTGYACTAGVCRPAS